MTWQKPFGKMDPKRQLFAPGKRHWKRRRKAVFSGERKSSLFSRGR